MLLSAVISPFLSAWVDRRHIHQSAVVLSSMLGATACITLALLPAESQVGIIVSIVIATVSFDMASIFTASLLPKLAQGRAADTLSSIGFAAGYGGGAIALILATSLIAARESFGLTAAGALRSSFAIMGLWWLVFSLPTAFVRMTKATSTNHSGTSTKELLQFLSEKFHFHCTIVT